MIIVRYCRQQSNLKVMIISYNNITGTVLVWADLVEIKTVKLFK